VPASGAAAAVDDDVPDESEPESDDEHQRHIVEIDVDELDDWNHSARSVFLEDEIDNRKYLCLGHVYSKPDQDQLRQLAFSYVSQANDTASASASSSSRPKRASANTKFPQNSDGHEVVPLDHPFIPYLMAALRTRVGCLTSEHIVELWEGGEHGDDEGGMASGVGVDWKSSLNVHLDEVVAGKADVVKDLHSYVHSFESREEAIDCILRLMEDARVKRYFDLEPPESKPQVAAARSVGQSKAWMTGDIFHGCMESLFEETKGDQSLRVIIMDNFSGHKKPEISELADENNSVILRPPAHSTCLLQPLDLNTNKPLKENLIDTSIRRANHVVCSELSPEEIKKLFDREDFMAYVFKAMNQVTAESIVSGFKSMFKNLKGMVRDIKRSLEETL
jgi:hypothetical protein